MLTLQDAIHASEKGLGMSKFATLNEPVWPQLVLQLILCLVHVLLGLAKLPEELKKFIQGDSTTSISVQYSTTLEQVLLN